MRALGTSTGPEAPTSGWGGFRALAGARNFSPFHGPAVTRARPWSRHDEPDVSFDRTREHFYFIPSLTCAKAKPLRTRGQPRIIFLLLDDAEGERPLTKVPGEIRSCPDVGLGPLYEGSTRAMELDDVPGKRHRDDS